MHFTCAMHAHLASQATNVGLHTATPSSAHSARTRRQSSNQSRIARCHTKLGACGLHALCMHAPPAKQPLYDDALARQSQRTLHAHTARQATHVGLRAATPSLAPAGCMRNACTHRRPSNRRGIARCHAKLCGRTLPRQPWHMHLACALHAHAAGQATNVGLHTATSNFTCCRPSNQCRTAPCHAKLGA